VHGEAPKCGVEAIARLSWTKAQVTGNIYLSFATDFIRDKCGLYFCYSNNENV